MSMIRCSECGKEISDKAKVCIHCGNPLEDVEQDNSVNEKKVKIKKNKKINKILLIILILLIHLILFGGATLHFLNSDTVTADVIYPIKTSGMIRFTTEYTYECNIVYEYKGIEYHDTLTFNDDNLPKEIKNSSKDPNFFDVKLKGYVYKNRPDNFIFDMEYYNMSKYAFYIQAILIIPSLWLIIRNIISLRKNRNNSEKGMNKVVLILIAFLVAAIVGSIIFFVNKNKDTSKYKTNNTSDDWGLTINGVPINLPCSADELTNAGVKITDSDTYYEKIMSTTNQTFSSVFANSDEWKKEIYLDLKTGSDVSKKEKNVTVSSIRYYVPAHTFTLENPNTSSFLTSSQFCIKNNITIGSKSEDVISTFGTDYEPKTETDLNGIYALIFYESANSTLTIGFENGIVREIKIVTYSSTNKQEDYNLESNSQDNSSSNSNDNSYNDTIDNTDDIDREELISTLNFYELRGWLKLTDIEHQEWEQCSNVELKQRLDKLGKDIETQEQYNNKYASKLNEIFSKEINVELNSSEDTNYKYTPSNKTQPKTRVEYVAINEDGISAIYYSIEMSLTVEDKTKGQNIEQIGKKYYKATNIQELDEIIKINNYDTQGTDNELSKATAGYPIDTYHSSGLPYYFYNAESYVLYYLPDENEEMDNY